MKGENSVISHILNTTQRLNTSIVMMSAAMAVYIICNEAHRNRQDKKIKNLEKEIEELKQTIGE